MSYTEYNLMVTGGDRSLIEKLRKENEEARNALSSDGRSLSAEKWYEWERDMRAFSKAHPTATFVLDGAGDEHEDRWRAYFVGGKMQLCNSAFEALDPKRLR